MMLGASRREHVEIALGEALVGTKHHKELLAPFGLDASDPNFWSMGLKVIEGLIDELEAMDKKAVTS